jgi:tRNA threonylcarbamoyladenosine biosynthesis protein TsaB
MITHHNAYFATDYFPSALTMNLLALEKYKSKDFEDTAYFEPFYLKDFKGLKLKDRKKKGVL